MSESPVIFLAFANDFESYLHKLTEEQHAVRRALEEMENQKLCKVHYETDADLDKIWSVFNKYDDRIAIFHYGGHAEDYSLLLRKANGDQQLVDGEGLTSFLGRQKGLQLVFLNGCSSKRQAEELRDKGVPAVIGTSEPIDDSAATTLSKAFYEALATGRSIEQAWLGAKDRVRSDKQTKEAGYQRSIRLLKPEKHRPEFPWELYIRPGAEIVKDWNLPGAARNPLFGLPLPAEAFLRQPVAPFVGLHYFREEDAAIFYGRGVQIRELYNHLQGIHPIILVYGKSGVGKSSMLDAGLLPRIKDKYKITYARRIQEKGLLGTLELALDELLSGPMPAIDEEEDFSKQQQAWEYLQRAAETITDPKLRREVEGFIQKLVHREAVNSVQLTDILRKWLAVEEEYEKPLVVILDQVEEKFTRPMPGTGNINEDELLVFLTAILPLFRQQNSGIEGKLILSYRKEYHPEIRDTFRQMSLPYAELFLKRLDRAGIVEAVRSSTLHDVTDEHGRVVQHNKTYNPFLLELEKSPEGYLPEIIADDLLEDPESPIAPVLQIILDKLWQSAPKVEGQPVRLTVAQYQELRKQGTTMGEFFQEQMSELKAKQAQAVHSGLALDLLYAHTTRMGTAGSCRREELFAAYDVPREDLAALLRDLEDLSLLVRIDTRQSQDTAGDQAYTTLLAHDTLAPVVIREYNLSDAPGQRAARILTNKLTDVGFQLPAGYLEKLQILGVPKDGLSALSREIVGREKFLAEVRNQLGEELYRKQQAGIEQEVSINIHPEGQEVYLEETDLAVVEQGGGLENGHYPGMRRLSRAEQLLVEDSRERKVERERRERERQEAEQRLRDEKLATERKAARRQRIFSGVIGVAFLIAIWMAFRAQAETRRAEEQTREAKASALAAQSLQKYPEDNTVALNLALASLKLSSENQDSKNALQKILGDPGRKFYQGKYTLDSLISDIKLAPGGEYFLVNFFDHTDSLSSLGFTPRASLWQITSEGVHRSPHFSCDLATATFAPNGKFLSFQESMPNGSVRTKIWDLPKDTLAMEIAGVLGDFSPDGRVLLLQPESSVAMWQAGHKSAQTFITEPGIEKIKLLPDGKHLLTYVPSEVHQGYTYLYDLSGNALDTIDNFKYLPVFPDHQSVLGVTGRGNVVRWQIDTREVTPFLEAIYYNPTYDDLVFSSEGRFLMKTQVSGGRFESNHFENFLIDTSNPESEFSIIEISNDFDFHSFSPDSRFIYGREKDRICRFDLKLRQKEYLNNDLARIDAYANINYNISPDYRYLLIADDQQVFLYPLFSGWTPKYMFDGLTLSSIDFSSNGRRVLTGNTGGFVGIWSNLGEPETRFKADSGQIRKVDFSPDDQHIITVGETGVIKLWSDKGEFIRSLSNNDDSEELDNAHFSPKGGFVIGLYGAGYVSSFDYFSEGYHFLLWDKAGDQLIEKPEIISYSISSDDRYILFRNSPADRFGSKSPEEAAYKDSIEIFSLSSGERLLAYYCRGCSAGFGVDGNTIVTSGERGLAIRDFTNGIMGDTLQFFKDYYLKDIYNFSLPSIIGNFGPGDGGSLLQYSQQSAAYELSSLPRLSGYDYATPASADYQDILLLQAENSYGENLQQITLVRNHIPMLQKFSIGPVWIAIQELDYNPDSNFGFAPNGHLFYSNTGEKVYLHAEFFWEWESGHLWKRVHKLTKEEREKYGIDWKY